jgi:hypothetical protein
LRIIEGWSAKDWPACGKDSEMPPLPCADEVRRAVLQALYQGWQLRPGPDDYFPLDRIMDDVRKRFPKRLDEPLQEGVLNSLLDEKLVKGIEAKDTNSGETRLAIQITETGRKYLNTPEEQRVNNPWVTGSFYLVTSVVILAVLGVLARSVPAWALAPILIGAILLVNVVGYIQLKNDDRIKDKTFTNLMTLVFNSIPLLRGGRKASRGFSQGS